MDTSIIGEFSVLSPSQKRELERKRKEKEARETAEAIRKEEATRKAREAAKKAEEQRREAAVRATEEKKEKITCYKKWIGIIWILIFAVICIWILFQRYYYQTEIKRLLSVRDDHFNIWMGFMLSFAFLTSLGGVPVIVGLSIILKKLKNKLEETIRKAESILQAEKTFEKNKFQFWIVLMCLLFIAVVCYWFYILSNF